MRKFTLRIATVMSLCFAAAACEKNQLPTAGAVLPVNVIGKTNAAPSQQLLTGVHTYFVSPSGTDGAGFVTQASPFKTVTYASTKTVAGDVVYLLDGQFNGTAVISVSGTDSQHIKYLAYPGAAPLIFGSGAIFNIVAIEADYIDFDGIEVKGDAANTALTVAGGNASETACRNGSCQTDYAKYNTNGILISDKTKNHHHISVTNCKVHDCPGQGICAEDADYVTISNNETYRNAFYTMYGDSGISTKDNFNYTTTTGVVKYMIRDNVSHDNQTKCYYLYASTDGKLSDGNGIQIDVNNYINGSYANHYLGVTRLENNICYNNGGAGIAMTESHDVQVVNSTTYNNGLSLNGSPAAHYPEMTTYGCYNISYYSNILYASSLSGSSCAAINTPKSADGTITTTGNIVFDYNIYYNSSAGLLGTHYKTTNPNFVSPTTNFRLNTGSSAANSGLGNTIGHSAVDILNVTRTVDASRGLYPDCGAYESFN